MKILIDTNVIIDIINNRKEFVQDSFAALQVVLKEHKACISTTTVTDVIYITKKAFEDSESQKQTLSVFFSKLKILPVTKKQIKQAFSSPMKDFEDAVQAFCAKKAGAKLIITRNTKDYALSPVKAITPADFLKMRQM